MKDFTNSIPKLTKGQAKGRQSWPNCKYHKKQIAPSCALAKNYYHRFYNITCKRNDVMIYVIKPFFNPDQGGLFGRSIRWGDQSGTFLFIILIHCQISYKSNKNDLI